MKTWHLGALFACIVILAVGSVAALMLYMDERENKKQRVIAAQLLTSQLAACHRGNALRAATSTLGEILSEFTVLAAAARSKSAALAKTPEEAVVNATAAASYRALNKRISLIPQVNCDLVIIRDPATTARR